MSATWLEDLATHVNEIAASMRHDANALEDISEIVESAVDAITPRPDVAQARGIANRVNAAVVHAMTLVAGLQRNAGRLEGLAHVCEMCEPDAESILGTQEGLAPDVWRAIGVELDEMQEQELGAIRKAHDDIRQRLQVISLDSSGGEPDGGDRT
jgi:hypothetical protein